MQRSYYHYHAVDGGAGGYGSGKDSRALMIAAGVGCLMLIGCALYSERDEILKWFTNALEDDSSNSKPKTVFPTHEWQEVPPHMAVPGGMEIRFDMETGKNYVRIPKSR